jgi:hypothetical protein
MDTKIIAVTAIAFLCLGYVPGNAQVVQVVNDVIQTAAPVVSTDRSKAVGTSDLFFDPLTPDPSALPSRSDFPVPANLRDNQRARCYTGIIKNKTGYEVSLPSENSDATLIIPPHSWIEYTMWTWRTAVTAYHDGKPFYCLKLVADPRAYPFMCSQYDFMAEIVKPEATGRSTGKYKPMKKRQRRVKKQPEC